MIPTYVPHLIESVSKAAIACLEEGGNQGLICILGVNNRMKKAWHVVHQPLFSFCLFVSSPAHFLPFCKNQNIPTMVAATIIAYSVIHT